MKTSITLSCRHAVCVESASLPNKLEHKIKNHVFLSVVIEDFSLVFFPSSSSFINMTCKELSLYKYTKWKRNANNSQVLG